MYFVCVRKVASCHPGATVWTAVLSRLLLGKVLHRQQWIGVAEVCTYFFLKKNIPFFDFLAMDQTLFLNTLPAMTF